VTLIYIVKYQFEPRVHATGFHAPLYLVTSSQTIARKFWQKLQPTKTIHQPRQPLVRWLTDPIGKRPMAVSTATTMNRGRKGGNRERKMREPEEEDART
jgi:hypothetical protein